MTLCLQEFAVPNCVEGATYDPWKALSDVTTYHNYRWVVVEPLELSVDGRRAIINLSVQASHRHRNSWKSHFLPQKVYKSAIWNESSVEWTLVDLDFAFVNDFQF